MNTAVYNLSGQANRVCLKVHGPNFVVGMTIDVTPQHPITTVGDLLSSLRSQSELAVICQRHNCNPSQGALYYRNVLLSQPQARLLEDVGVDYMTLTSGGSETLEYRIQNTPIGTNTSDQGTTTSQRDPFQSALQPVLRQQDPVPTLNGLLKVLGNIVQHPDNPKYQRIKRENPKFQELVGSHPGGIEALVACGFRDHVILEDNIEYIQFQLSESNLQKLRAAEQHLRHIQAQLMHAQTLVQTVDTLVVAMGPAYESLQIYRRILGRSHVLVGKGMNLVSMVLYQQGQDNNAMTLCDEAKEMVEELGGPNHPFLPLILGNLAYMLRNDPERREEMQQHMERALQLQQPPTVPLLSFRAGVQMTLRNYDDAIGQWEQLLDNIQESDREYFVILGNLALARTKANDDVGAERDYLSAVRVCEQHEGPHHYQIAGILTNLAIVQDRLQKSDDAIHNLERALSIRTNSMGFHNHLTQQVFGTLCEMLERHKKYTPLVDHLRRCANLTLQALGPNHPHSAKAFMNAGLILYRFQNNAQDAVPLLRQALGLFQSSLGAEHSETVLAAINLGAALKIVDPTEAESILLEAVGTAEFRTDNRCLGPAFSALGALDLDVKSDTDMAVFRLERALELCVQAHGNGAWYTEITRRDLGRAYVATNRPERGRSLYNLCRPYFESKLLATDERLISLLREVEEVDN